MFDSLPTVGVLIEGFGENSAPWLTEFMPLVYLFGGIGLAFMVIRWLTTFFKR